MPEYTEHELSRLHAIARQQIRLVALADTAQAASNRRFNVIGILQGMVLCGGLTDDQANALVVELQQSTVGQIDHLTREALRDCWPPEPAVHCTGHVDYDPSSRVSLAKNLADADRGPVYNALLEHLDHLLDDLLPLASDHGAFQILTAGRATVRSLQDQDLISQAEADALLDRVHGAYRDHDAPGVPQ